MGAALLPTRHSNIGGASAEVARGVGSKESKITGFLLRSLQNHWQVPVKRIQMAFLWLFFKDISRPPKIVPFPAIVSPVPFCSESWPGGCFVRFGGEGRMSPMAPMRFGWHCREGVLVGCLLGQGVAFWG